MKKMIACLLAVSVLSIYAVPMYAASGGWTMQYVEPTTSANPINKDTEFIETVTLEGSEYCPEVSGKVLHAQFARSKQANTWLIAENSLNAAMSNGSNYDFSFCAKGTFQNKGIYAGIGTNDNLTSGGLVTLLNMTRYSTENLSNGWKRYSFTNIPYNGSGSHFRIKITEQCTDLYIDNVSLKKSGETDELVVDGGFEETNFVETEDVGNQAQYAPQNFIATQLAGHIMISWRNPENTNLSKVSLYEIADGEETLIKNDFSKTANAYLSYDAKSLEEGSKHTYKLVCEFGASTATESVISAIASNKRDPSPFGVTVRGNHPGTSYYERGDAHSGKSSARVISNLQSWTSNNFIMAQTPTIAFNSGSEYEISVWVKGRVANSLDINYRDFIKDGTPSSLKYNGGTPTFTLVETENDWKHIVFKISDQGSTPLSFMGEHRTDVLIDDLEVWELNGGERGEKPVYSEDYESRNYEVPDVTDCSYEINRKLAKISFTAPEGVNRVRIYVKDGDKLSKRADIFADDRPVTFTRLKNDHNYTYVIKAVDGYFNESEGKEITVTPTPDDWECTEYGLYNGIVETASGFEGEHTYSAKATIKNNKVDAGFDAQIIAVVRKDGERINAVASNVTKIAKNKYDETPTVIETADISIPDITDGEYEISVYLWDGLDTMTILAPFKIYKEKAAE